MSTTRSRTIVTGGAGFVGSHLLDALLAAGHELLVIDNFFVGRRTHIPLRVALSEIDLATVGEAELRKVLREFSPNNIVHLAAIHHIPYCLTHPTETFASNARATDVLVTAATELPACKIVAASTADVYENSELPHSERDPVGPSNSYGLSKVLVEEILACGVRANAGLTGVALRFFNIYGTRETNSHVIPRVIELIQDKSLKEIRMGYLGGTRDFVHVSDAVTAIVKALEYEGRRYNAFNIGTGIPTQIRRIVELLMQGAGDKREVIEDAAKFRKFERKSLTADSTKAREVLGWTPTCKVEDGLLPILEEAGIELATISH